MKPETTIVHIEDDVDWRHEIQEYIIRFSDLQIRNFVSVSSVSEVSKELYSISGPMIVILDLRLGGTNTNYHGYHWLLEELEEFLRTKANAAVFVISGQLHEGIKETLVRRGLPKQHIYSKGEWADQRRHFLTALNDAIGNLEKLAESDAVKDDGDTRQSHERKSVFISYSHKDEKWLKRLQVHLAPLERAGIVQRWDDTRITPGSRWREEIKKALQATKVAILLISADFLASDFISTNELPPLLAAAEADGAVILPIIISPCWFGQTASLSQFQAVNPPSRPLIGMKRAAQEDVFVNVMGIIAKTLH